MPVGRNDGRILGRHLRSLAEPRDDIVAELRDDIAIINITNIMRVREGWGCARVGRQNKCYLWMQERYMFEAKLISADSHVDEPWSFGRRDCLCTFGTRHRISRCGTGSG